MRSQTILAAVLFASIAHRAAAEGFISPMVSTTLSAPSPSANNSSPGFSLAFGRLGHLFGAETEITYFPEMIDTSASSLRQRVFTFSENFVVGQTIGRIKPYGAIGFGDLLSNVHSIASAVGVSADSISNNYFTFNAGGGVMGFFKHNIAVRGDLRYFRAYGFDLTEAGLSSGNITLNHFDFWRLGGGVVFTF